MEASQIGDTLHTTVQEKKLHKSILLLVGNCSGYERHLAISVVLYLNNNYGAGSACVPFAGQMFCVP